VAGYYFYYYHHHHLPIKVPQLSINKSITREIWGSRSGSYEDYREDYEATWWRVLEDSNRQSLAHRVQCR
jgi:hypothetical protein